MKLKKNEKMNGFIVNKIIEVPEVAGIFFEMEHENTGAKLGWLKTEDDNKTFSITFQTIPENNSGVFHIIEHSVLQGSKKYPVKSPIVELMKGSLNTFVNAMTFSDKTIYPVSSRNGKDFENLMNVYLDAVFHPLLCENEKIFQQEGWHYESDKEDGKYFYNGIVLNEMRGVTSIDSLINNEMKAALFLENCYRYVSGGSPDAIVDLTYEEFLTTYKKYYHPSNSYIVLDGNLNIENTLWIINEYLSEFERRTYVVDIPIQKGNGMVKVTRNYAVESIEEKQGYLALGFVSGKYDELKKSLAMKILADYLVDSNEAPLKKAILEGGYGYDITAYFADGMLQHYLFFTVRNMDTTKRDEIETLIYDTLTKEVVKGMDKEQLDALLCQLEFIFRERDFGGYPAGIINAINIMESWLYGDDATMMLLQNRYFDELRAEIKDGSFQKYLVELLLKNNHCASVLMEPSVTYLKDEKQKEEERLDAFIKDCDVTARKKLWEGFVAFKEWQTIPSTKKEIETLPSLKLSDVEKEPIAVSNQILEDGTMWHTANTREIKYMRLYFQMKEFDEEELSMAAFICSILGELPLNDMPKAILDIEKRRTFGIEHQYLQIISQSNDNLCASVYFVIDASYLETKESDAIKLIQNIALNSDYTKTELIGMFLRQKIENCQQNMIMNGHQMAMLQAKSASTKESYYANCANGPAFCLWLKKALKEFEEDGKAFSRKLELLAKRILASDDLLVSMTSRKQKEQYTEYVRGYFPKRMTRGSTINRSKAVSIAREKKIAISIPSQVSYTAKAANLNQVGIENTGSWQVFAKIASMDYLWNEIRVLGGAYGTGMNVSIGGSVSYYSYRDPNPGKSLEIFDEVGNYIRNIAKDNLDITRLIIGTIASTESLFTPYSMGKTADVWYLSGVTDEIRRERRKQILETTVEKLVVLANQLDKLVSHMDYSVVANWEILKSISEKITGIYSL